MCRRCSRHEDRLLVLRPQPGADETAARARALGLEPVVAPLFSVRPLHWTPPDPDRVRRGDADQRKRRPSGGHRPDPLPVLSLLRGRRGDRGGGRGSGLQRHPGRRGRRQGAAADDGGGRGAHRLPRLRPGSSRARPSGRRDHARPGLCRRGRRAAAGPGRRHARPAPLAPGGRIVRRAGGGPGPDPYRRDQREDRARRRRGAGSRSPCRPGRAIRPYWSLPPSCARKRKDERRLRSDRPGAAAAPPALAAQGGGAGGLLRAWARRDGLSALPMGSRRALSRRCPAGGPGREVDARAFAAARAAATDRAI